jgi:hypothetical protein
MESNANPACPKCQSGHTERQDFMHAEFAHAAARGAFPLVMAISLLRISWAACGITIKSIRVVHELWNVSRECWRCPDRRRAPLIERL